jgi:hypothetical protein
VTSRRTSGLSANTSIRYIQHKDSVKRLRGRAFLASTGRGKCRTYRGLPQIRATHDKEFSILPPISRHQLSPPQNRLRPRSPAHPHPRHWLPNRPEHATQLKRPRRGTACPARFVFRRNEKTAAGRSRKSPSRGSTNEMVLNYCFGCAIPVLVGVTCDMPTPALADRAPGSSDSKPSVADAATSPPLRRKRTTGK